MKTEQEVGLSNWKKRFFSIWAGQAVSQLGSRLVGFAFVWHLTETTGSATVLALATMMSILPEVIISPFAGALVDRWNRKKVMIITDILTALVTFIIALLFAFTEVKIWQIYIVLFIRSVFGVFQWPAMLTSTSLMVPKAQLARISGLNQTLSGAMGILAPPLGAFLIGLLPMWGVLSVDIITAIVAIIPLLLFTIPQPIREEEIAEVTSKVKSHLLQDLKEGIQYVISLPGLLMIILTATLLNFLISPAFSLLPLMITDYFKKGVIELGIAESLFSIGFLIGGLTLSIWGGFKNRLLTSSIFLISMGITISLIGIIPPGGFYVAIVVMAVAGICNPLVNGPLMAAMQARVAPDKQGRVFSLVGAGAAAAMPIGLAIAGPLSDKIGVRYWFIVGGIVTTIIGTLLLINKNVMSLGKDLPASAEQPAPVAVEE